VVGRRQTIAFFPLVHFLGKMKIGPQENAFDPSSDLDLLNVAKHELYACTLYEYGRESESVIALAREMQDLTFEQSRTEIKREANAWIERMLCRKNVRSIRGRHAVPSTAFNDRLRELVAMRLLAHSPLKEVIEFVHHYRQRTGRDIHLYADRLEDKRPTGRTAWQNGVEAARKGIQKTFQTTRWRGTDFLASLSREKKR
jgi:hypothetical protein